MSSQKTKILEPMLVQYSLRCKWILGIRTKIFFHSIVPMFTIVQFCSFTDIALDAH